MTFSDDRDETYPYKTIGTDDAKSMIEAGARVIDVRRPDEWQRGSCRGRHPRRRATAQIPLDFTRGPRRGSHHYGQSALSPRPARRRERAQP